MNRSILAACIALTVSACASSGGSNQISTADRLALYRANAGAPVFSFRPATPLRWTALGNSTLAVWGAGARGDHLLELRGTCSGLFSAQTLYITNAGGRVTLHDSVQVNPPRGSFAIVPTTSCRIRSIQPIDAAALRDDKRELRDAQAVERAAGDVDPDAAAMEAAVPDTGAP